MHTLRNRMNSDLYTISLAGVARKYYAGPLAREVSEHDVDVGLQDVGLLESSALTVPGWHNARSSQGLPVSCYCLDSP